MALVKVSSPGKLHTDAEYRQKREHIFRDYDKRKYISVGGRLLCKECNEEVVFDDPTHNLVVMCACKCDEKRRREKEERIRQTEKSAAYSCALQRFSTLRGKYRQASFSTLQLSDASEEYITTCTRCEAFCRNIAAVEKTGRGIWLWGNTGVGKTHIAACMAASLPQKTVIFTSADRIMDEIFAIYKDKERTEESVKSALSDVDVLFVDDIDALIPRKSEAWQAAGKSFAEIFVRRIDESKPTVITARRSLSDFASREIFDEAVIDRLAATQVLLHLDGKNRFLTPQGGNEF